MVGSLTMAAIATATAIVSAAPGQFADLSSDLVREPAIAYFTRPAADRVARLNADVQRGAVQLTFDPAQGYLLSILHALRMPAASQVLVFTKSSVQAPRISPRNRTGGQLRPIAAAARSEDAPAPVSLQLHDLFGRLRRAPPQARDAIYQRMWIVLSGKDTSPKYARLSAADRRAVVEILRDTKKDLPAYFR